MQEAHLCFSQLTCLITHPLNYHIVWHASCMVGLIRGAGTEDPAISKTNRTGKGYWKKCWGKGNWLGLHCWNLWCSDLCADSSHWQPDITSEVTPEGPLCLRASEPSPSWAKEDKQGSRPFFYTIINTISQVNPFCFTSGPFCIITVAWRVSSFTWSS